MEEREIREQGRKMEGRRERKIRERREIGGRFEGRRGRRERREIQERRGGESKIG